MLLNLVKKDFLLVKKYLILMFVAAIVLPVLISTKTDTLIDGGILAFFISTLFIQFRLFISVSMLEYKYKGCSLLCATPYRRNALVISKYLFLLIMFIGCYILYTMTSLVIPKQLDLLSFSDLGFSFLILTLIFSIMIPVQYRFGFDKAKYIFFFGVFITPFIVPVIIDYIQANDLNVQFTLPAPQIILDLVPIVLALVIGSISMIASMRIFGKKDL